MRVAGREGVRLCLVDPPWYPISRYPGYIQTVSRPYPLCFYVLGAFLPSLPGWCRDADPLIKTPPGGGSQAATRSSPAHAGQCGSGSVYAAHVVFHCQAGVQARGSAFGVCMRATEAGHDAPSVVQVGGSRAPSCSKGWSVRAEEEYDPQVVSHICDGSRHLCMTHSAHKSSQCIRAKGALMCEVPDSITISSRRAPRAAPAQSRANCRSRSHSDFLQRRQGQG